MAPRSTWIDCGSLQSLAQRVSVLPAVQCGTCDRCQAGSGQLCANQGGTSLGLGLNDGAYAEYFSGVIDDVWVFEGAATAAQIVNLLGPNEPDTDPGS